MGSTSQQSSSSPSPPVDSIPPKKPSLKVPSPSIEQASVNPQQQKPPLPPLIKPTIPTDSTPPSSSSIVANCPDESEKILTTKSEIFKLLAERDQEILALKTELEKCKLALQQTLSECRLIQQRWLDERNKNLAKSDSDSSNVDTRQVLIRDNFDDNKLKVRRDRHQSLCEIDSIIDQDEHKAHTDINKLEGSIVKDTSKTHQSAENLNFKQKQKVIFKTGADDDQEPREVDKSKLSDLNDLDNCDVDEDDDDVDDILNVGEIDSDDSEEIDKDNDNRLNRVSRISSQSGRSSGIMVEENNGQEEEEDEDVISDGLLTSLTDAAINNLSQLAALQERCESQQHQEQSSQTTMDNSQSVGHGETGGGGGGGDTDDGDIDLNSTADDEPLMVSGLLPGRISGPQTVIGDYPPGPLDPFSARSISNQAAIALNAAAAAAVASGVPTMTSAGSLLPQQQDEQQQHLRQQPISSSSSISPNSTIQADLSQSHSLASVVAAAAYAAAAANADQSSHNNQHQHPIHGQQARLISSAIPSPEFYQSLQQNSHAQTYHQQHQLASGLHYPQQPSSSSVTPSPSSLMAQSVRRSLVSSNTTTASSTSIMSPISSPNFLRRQFMPDRSMAILTPSPSSGLTTGTSSGGSATSTSLAHLLQHHQHNQHQQQQHHQQQQQQRSASALAGSSAIMTPSPSTSISASGGSTAVSPMMSNKNSSQARLNNMQIRHKFGYLGSARAQFNSPHGFCLGLNQEIVVADTNNHRICIFDKSGTYITQFGTPGKEDGQLWNPRKVAILYKVPTSSSLSNHQLINNSNLKTHQSHHNQQQQQQHITSTNNSQLNNGVEPLYVVCDRGAERSRMQLFTKDGAFIKKIGIHYIDIVAGLAITQNGLIIVVDSVSPTVYIINGETGILNGWFDCSGHMKEPSDIAVKSDVPGNEYFICDFKGHCVVVFSEQGEYLRKIGHDGLTSYPNGIDISDDGDILVGDSHGNRFHVVVFDRNGNFVSQFECPHVKVSRCCGLKITREGYIVTLAKNNHHVLVLDTIHI